MPSWPNVKATGVSQTFWYERPTFAKTSAASTAVMSSVAPPVSVRTKRRSGVRRPTHAVRSENNPVGRKRCCNSATPPAMRRCVVTNVAMSGYANVNGYAAA
jgi:hypothetical protein